MIHGHSAEEEQREAVPPRCRGRHWWLQGGVSSGGVRVPHTYPLIYSPTNTENNLTVHSYYSSRPQACRSALALALALAPRW